MAAQAESARKLFYSPNGQLAFKHNRGFEAESGCRNDNLALQTHTRFKRLAGDAIESFAPEIFGGALNRWPFGAGGADAPANALLPADVCGDRQMRP